MGRVKDRGQRQEPSPPSVLCPDLPEAHVASSARPSLARCVRWLTPAGRKAGTRPAPSTQTSPINTKTARLDLGTSTASQGLFWVHGPRRPASQQLLPIPPEHPRSNQLLPPGRQIGQTELSCFSCSLPPPVPIRPPNQSSWQKQKMFRGRRQGRSFVCKGSLRSGGPETPRPWSLRRSGRFWGPRRQQDGEEPSVWTVGVHFVCPFICLALLLATGYSLPFWYPAP